ncbi:hypothetical protein ACHAXA_010444 [Cyclostephanos tholiformis]|uniref:Uncharacterized protein n=1 Tax=Cyclostephanos tholiformis TaxID=382380 RepID=A0ABD3SFJ2_9STRA
MERGVDVTRARYLLEASAGNVGLASALYWEDYLANVERWRQRDEDVGGGGGRGGIAESLGGVGGGGSGANDDDDDDISEEEVDVGGGGGSAADAAVGGGGSPQKSRRRIGDESGDDYHRRIHRDSSCNKLYKRSDAVDHRHYRDSSHNNHKRWMPSGTSLAAAAAMGATKSKMRGEECDDDGDSDDVEDDGHPYDEGEGKRMAGKTGGGAAAADDGGRRGRGDGSGDDDDDGDGSRRGGSPTLSSMHHFQRQLDEKISSLEERLKSYRSRLSSREERVANALSENTSSYRSRHHRSAYSPMSSFAERAGAASASFPSSGNRQANNKDDATMQAAVSSALRAAEQQRYGGEAGGGGLNGAASRNHDSNNDNDEASDAAVAGMSLAKYHPDMWRVNPYAAGGGGTGSAALAALGLSPGQYALYGDHSAAAGDGMFRGGGGGDRLQDGHRAFVAAMNATLRGSSSVAAAAAASSVGGAAFAAGGGGGGGGAMGQLNYGAGQLPFDWLSRMAYNQARAAAAVGGGLAPSMNDAVQQAEASAIMAVLARGDNGAMRVHAQAAVGGVEGGNGGDGNDSDSGDEDDEDNEDSSGYGDGAPQRAEREQEGNNEVGNRDNVRVDYDGAVGGGNGSALGRGGGGPLRRSMRIHSARNRRIGTLRNPPPNYQPRRGFAARRRGNNGDDGGDGMAPDLDNGPAMLRRALEAAAAAANINIDASVDVSDDEDVSFLPGPEPVFRLKRGKSENETSFGSTGKRNRLDDQGNDNPKLGSRRDSYDDEGSGSNDESVETVNDLLSNDLLFDELLFDELSDNSDSTNPSSQLWKSYPRHTEDSDGSDDDGNNNSANGRVNIPLSWLRSGFMLSKCGNGLAMSAPPDDEWDRMHRQSYAFPILRDGPLKGAKGLFPYNCKGVSALLSIVTALLYSGASIRGGATVACDLDRIPFDELTLDQRKREFDSRLTDALSSLIFIAAKAGSQRCLEKLQAYDRKWARRRRKGLITPKDEADYTQYRLRLQRRTRVCRVCWWETDATNGNVTIFPEGRSPKDINLKISFTNIQDIKSYVKTNLRSFKEPGGCALLLETILCCHGPYASFPQTLLLSCKCSESLNIIETRAKDKSGSIINAPESHDCVSVELLSLLLTGCAHSNYSDWSGDMFGIGLLHINTNGQNKLNTRLLRPVKPIWICLGDLGYSTLFLEMNNFIGSINSLDNPGKIMSLAHWNCWSGERTGFRVITSMHDKEPHHTSRQNKTVHIPDTSSDSEEEGRPVTDSISSKLRQDLRRDAAMLWTPDRSLFSREHPSGVDHDFKPINDDELQSVTFHPDDEKYYPGQYRRWRFKFDSYDSTLPSNIPAVDAEWIPFYRLHGRQRLIIEMKLAPRICAIVRTRWPLAIVRDFVPTGEFPLV